MHSQTLLLTLAIASLVAVNSLPIPVMSAKDYDPNRRTFKEEVERINFLEEQLQPELGQLKDVKAEVSILRYGRYGSSTMTKAKLKKLGEKKEEIKKIRKDLDRMDGYAEYLDLTTMKPC